MEVVSLIQLTGIVTKSRLSGDMLPNIKTCGSGWSNFSENLRILALKLFRLTWFVSPNLSIFSYFLLFWTEFGSVVIESDFKWLVHLLRSLCYMLYYCYKCFINYVLIKHVNKSCSNRHNRVMSATPRPSIAPGLDLPGILHTCAADFYEWFIHKMRILDTEILKKCFNYWRKWIN